MTPNLGNARSALRMTSASNVRALPRYSIPNLCLILRILEVYHQNRPRLRPSPPAPPPHRWLDGLGRRAWSLVSERQLQPPPSLAAVGLAFVGPSR